MSTLNVKLLVWSKAEGGNRCCRPGMTFLLSLSDLFLGHCFHPHPYFKGSFQISCLFAMVLNGMIGNRSLVLIAVENQPVSAGRQVGQLFFDQLGNRTSESAISKRFISWEMFKAFPSRHRGALRLPQSFMGMWQSISLGNISV